MKKVGLGGFAGGGDLGRGGSLERDSYTFLGGGEGTQD